MWSLAVLGVLRAPMLASLADRLEDFNVASNMTPVHARQILVVRFLKHANVTAWPLSHLSVRHIWMQVF